MPNSTPLTYASAGVNVDLGDAQVDEIQALAKKTHRSEVISGVGGFAALFALNDMLPRLQDPVLVSGTDGVGTKLLVAQMAERYEGLGQDLVAMCVNDVLTTGAKPLFFLDYFATGGLSESPLIEVVRGISHACKACGCALVGGETAEMPGLYQKGHFDLAGFCVGAVERSQIIDGRLVKAKDAIIGLASSGLHSNGYALARKIIFEHMHKSIHDPLYDDEGGSVSVADELLKPTRIYVNTIHSLLSNGIEIRAMAHITGGGLPLNLTRSFPKGLSAKIDLKSFTRPPIFSILQEAGHVDESEMQKTFNLGIGYALVISNEHVTHTLQLLETLGEAAVVLGEVSDHDGPVLF